jgi:thiol:disulfide interchange protein DsbD
MPLDASTTFAVAAGRGVISALLFSLTAGLLTALTPCVYPMIPITISIFGGKHRTGRARALLLATAYVAGIATMFGALGTIFALLGKAFGTFLANPWVIVPLALFFVAMAASMFGAFELGLPSAVQARLSRVGGRGVAGAFLMGIVGGLIAAPCTGPPLAGILAYVATTRDGAYGFVLLATYAVGIGLPFWAIAGFSMTLPRSGSWMESVKSVFGIALLVAALYYLKNVVPALGRLTDPHPGFLATALLMVAAGIAIGAVHLSFHDGIGRGARKGLGVALAAAGLFATTNWVLTPTLSSLRWFDREDRAVTEATAKSQKLLIDFRADWCLPCKELEIKVFANPKVVEELQNFVLLKVDLTHEDDDPRLGALKRKYHVNTLPAVRVATANGATLGELNELVTVEEFLAQIGQLRGIAEAPAATGIHPHP